MLRNKWKHKPRSRQVTTLHPHWLGQQTGWTAPKAGVPVQSFRLDAKLQWKRTFWPKLQDWCPQHRYRRQRRLQEKITPCFSQPKESSWFSPAVTLLLQDSWHSTHSPTLPRLASPISNVGCVENACCLGNFTRIHNHESEERLPYKKCGSKNDWAFSQHRWAQSQKTDHHCWPSTLSSFYKFVWTAFFAGAYSRYSHRRLCRWCNPMEKKHVTAFPPPALTSSEYHLIFWTASVPEKKISMKNNIHHGVRKKPRQTTKQYEERRMIFVEEKKTILICHYWIKNLCQLLNTDGTAKCDQLVTCRANRSDNRVGRKVVWNKINRI